MALEDKDIDTQMAGDWAAIREKFKEEIPAAEETTTEEPASPEKEPVAEPARERNEDGTFAPKAKESATPAEPAQQKSAPDPAQPEQTPAAAPAERDINRPPSTWKPTARAEWEKLPPAVKAEVHRRETDWLNGQAQLLPDAKLGKSINEIMQPYQMLIQAEGGTTERAIADLMRTAAIFRVGTPQQKTQAVQQIIRQFNVDMGTAGNQPQQGQPAQQQPPSDPRVDQLLAELNAERQANADREKQALEASVTRWMDQKDETGNPKFPYLGDVMQEMAILVPQIRQSSPSLSHEEVLQNAYDRATWGNPEIRTLLMKAQTAAQARPSENQNRVREAKRAASVNVPRRASTPSPGKPGKMEDTIAETARELGLIT